MRAMFVLTLLLSAAASAQAAETPPAWAYPVDPPGRERTPDDGIPRHVPDSEATFTVTDTRNPYFSPDWHPGDHPPMPPIVAQGRKPGVFACGLCHRADGSGGPENARVAGLPVAYAIQQVADIKAGLRKTSVPARIPPRLMANIAANATEAEVAEAAAYFAAVPVHPQARVVEAETVPTTTSNDARLALAVPAGSEPIGQRIIEVPEDEQDFALRDGRARFIAYVPPGSVAKGQALASASDGKSGACIMCHGADLKGLGPIPGLAGRSPSYLMRQLFDFKSGARAGAWSALMKPVAERLAIDDMLALAAYAASLPP